MVISVTAIFPRNGPDWSRRMHLGLTSGAKKPRRPNVAPERCPRFKPRCSLPSPISPNHRRPHGPPSLPRAHWRAMAFPLLPTARIARIADLSGTFFFALEGGLTGLAVGLDPIGVLVLAFLTGLGGGLV